MRPKKEIAVIGPEMTVSLFRCALWTKGWAKVWETPLEDLAALLRSKMIDAVVVLLESRGTTAPAIAAARTIAALKQRVPIVLAVPGHEAARRNVELADAGIVFAIVMSNEPGPLLDALKTLTKRKRGPSREYCERLKAECTRKRESAA